MRRLLMVGVVVGLSGCQSIDERIAWQVEQLPPSATKQYREGYADGCHTGKHERCIYTPDTRAVRDESRMRADQEYMLGWQDGARKCSTECAAATGGSPMFIRTK